MLIILICDPVASPLKAVFPEQTVYTVISVDHIIFVFSPAFPYIPLGINPSIFRCYGILLYKRIYPGIKINGLSISMIGQMAGSFHNPVVKCGSIVRFHRFRIICTILINQLDTFDRILHIIKLLKDLHCIFCNGFMYQQLSVFDLAVISVIFNPHVTEFLKGDVRIRPVGNTIDFFPYFLRNLFKRKTADTFIGKSLPSGILIPYLDAPSPINAASIILTICLPIPPPV